MSHPRTALSVTILLLAAACARQQDQTRNDAAIVATQERTMKKANDDVEAAMAEAGMAIDEAAPRNATGPH